MMKNKRKRKGSETLEAALTAPLIFVCLFAICFLMQIHLREESEFFTLARQVDQMQQLSRLAESVTEPVNCPDLYEIRTFSANNPVPLFGKRQYAFAETVRYHLFSGISSDSPLGMDTLETDGEEVWVFPMRGEKYHKKACRIVTVYPMEHLLTPALQKERTPCRLCCDGTETVGMPVYCFMTGDVYHRKECSQVTRYVRPMTQEAAEEQGYTPCSYCN